MSRQAGGEHSGRPAALLLVFGVLLAAAVGLLGWYQFSRRADSTIDIVREHRIPGTDKSIGRGILGYLEELGVPVVSDGFKPSWGAEEGPGGSWTVAYVYEADRRARWVSWRVYPATGRVVALDETAKALWSGAGRGL